MMPIIKTAAEMNKFLAKKMAQSKKKIAAQKKAGTYVAPKRTSRKEEIAVDNFMRAKGDLQYANRYGYTKANPKTKLQNKVKSTENKLKKIVEEEGGKYSPKNYFSKGGAVNSKKSCGLAVRGYGAITK
jgi:hypothetical protein|tara:strand:+ start:1108 stop:1494 length:387 start_codon:yes stop_codon:yes gene_type:complete